MRRVNLSQQQWNEIQKAGGLPDDAQQSIENVLANYRAFQKASASEPRAAQTRKELRHIAKVAEKFITAIVGVKSGSLQNARVKPDLLAALMLPTVRLATKADDRADGRKTAVVSAGIRDLGTPTTRDTLKLVHERVLMIEQLRRWFENAARSLPAEASGAHRAAENRLWLVRQLDAILAEFTGRQGRLITRTNKADHLQRFFKLCYAVADPNARADSINSTIKVYITRNPQPRTSRARITRKRRGQF